MQQLVIDYYKKYGKLPKFSTMAFADNVETALKMPPERALKFLKQKSQRVKVTTDWEQMSNEAHQKAFTVSKVMSADILQEIANYVQKAVKEGKPFSQFKKEAKEGGLIERMQKAGWTGKNPSRLKVIYNTNLSMAAAKGKYQQMLLTKDLYPNVKYLQVERKTKRHDHSKLHGHVFSLDDPILNTIAPPSAFLCKCRLAPTKEQAMSSESFTDLIKDSQDFKISPLKEWIPDFTKYSDKLKGFLEKDLNKNAVKIEKPKEAKTEEVKKAKELTDSEIREITDLYEKLAPNSAFYGKEYLAFKAIAKKQGFTEKPKVIRKDEFDKLPKTKHIITYRGLSDSKYYEDFKTGEYFAGTGIYGAGTYTGGKGVAKGYSSSGETLKIAIPKTAKIIDRKQIKLEMEPIRKEYLKKFDEIVYSSLTGEEYRNAIIKLNNDYFNLDYGVYAISKGYDVLKISDAEGRGGHYYIILNRSILTVQDELEY